MAEPVVLSSGPGVDIVPDGGGGTTPRLSERYVPERSSGVQSAGIFLGLTSVLLAGFFVLRGREGLGGSHLHTSVELLATALAVFAGCLALVRFFSKKQVVFVLIGTGLLGTGVLDGAHTALTSPVGLDSIDPGFPDLLAWTWLASRLYLSIFFYLSWMGWRWERWNVLPGRTVDEARVFVAGGTLLAIFVFVILLAPSPQARYPDFVIQRPAELLAGLFFLLALAGYVEKGTWRWSQVDHWLIVALVMSVFSQVYMAFSGDPFDALFEGAVALKLASYLTIGGALLVSVFLTFRAGQDAYLATREANANLLREVTVRREAERVARESEARYQDLLDSANDLIQSTAPDGRLLYANRAWRETLGYRSDEVAGLNLLDIIHEDYSERYRETVRQVLSGSSVPGVEVGLLAAEGRLVLCRGSLSCRIQGGEPVSVRSILRDVTAERQAAQDLEASRANLSALVESTGDAIWSVGRDHRLITFNSAFALEVEALTGREPHAGDLPESLVPSGEAGWLRDLFERALQGRRFTQVWAIEVGGESRSFEFFFNPVLSRNGTSGVVVFSRDVTSRKRTEEALRVAKDAAETANRAKSQFLASMSHELRTPLNSVIGFANILLKNRHGNLGDQELSFLRRILDNGRHLLVLINEFLDLAKIEAGRMELEIGEVDLAALVRETVAQLEGPLREKPVVLRSEIPEGLRPALTDAAKLKQVLINLIGNGLKFTEQGSVTVSLEADDFGLVRGISVTDTGIGIPSDRLRTIFEAFQQAEAGTSRRFGGTGLGLTISRAICHLLGYELTVDSEVGRGSRFTIQLTHRSPSGEEAQSVRTRGEREWTEVGETSIELAVLVPTDEEAPRPAVMAGDTSHAITARTALVIDDDPAARVLMRNHLEDMGYRVLAARSGGEGLRIARGHTPDLIILDLLMPGMSGWEVLGKLKADPDLREVPVIVATAVRSGRGQFLGSLDRISKPLDRDAFYRAIQRQSDRMPRRALVIDDDRSARSLLRRFLQDAGVEVKEAEDGHQGLYQLTRFEPDIVILDIFMPLMNGFEFLDRLRETPGFRGVPVVVVTGKDLTREQVVLLERRASAQVVKGPDLRDRLREAVESLDARRPATTARS